MYIYILSLIGFQDLIYHSNIASKAKQNISTITYIPRIQYNTMLDINNNIFTSCLSLDNKYYHLYKEQRGNLQIINKLL